MTVVSSIRTSTGKLAAGAFLALSLSLAGCASTQGVNTVSPGALGQSSRVYQGTVMSVREVTVKPKQSMIGTAAGAVLGGLAGSELGGGDKAQTAGAIGGAVLGGMAGNAAGKAVGTGKAFAYVVRFSSGETQEIIQGADVYIAPGTPVDIIASPDGWKLIPAAAY
ncbi:glycine zipper 2TM domain-containing protein [uncultured Hyphomonas sp.]|uniref:glycine zipper 2TM domain-containing protein n=1 Tax=uncultured Hyphomonas sp. TaxID=225298 RepID=UPI002AAB2294|nr:glycine zipper 2TM domain-containing protein [uncultured Hyphomonas sp.]